MKICIPVDEDKGLESPVCAHFGSAPAFLIIESETKAFQIKHNQDIHHAHGMCRPLASLDGENIHGIVVGGIGQGAFNKLKAANIAVYHSEYKTVAETIEAFNTGKLHEVTLQTACAHHRHGECHS